MSNRTLSGHIERLERLNSDLAMRHTRALPRSSRWERFYRRIFGVNPQSVVDRRMEALARDEAERKAWIEQLPKAKP